MSDIKGHYCGQTQPHGAHVWTTPPAFGYATVISTYQCAGLTSEAGQRADRLRAAVEALVRDAERFPDVRPLQWWWKQHEVLRGLIADEVPRADEAQQVEEAS